VASTLHAVAIAQRRGKKHSSKQSREAALDWSAVWSLDEAALRVGRQMTLLCLSLTRGEERCVVVVAEMKSTSSAFNSQRETTEFWCGPALQESDVAACP
jgi:hypothetical protein